MSWLYSIVFAGLLFGSDSDRTSLHIQDAVQPTVTTEIVVADEIEKFEQTYPLSKNGNVSVSNVNGSITVEAWDREEVRLEVTKIADSKETLAEVDIEIQSTADSFSAEADYKRHGKWNDRRNENKNRKLEVEFRLSVPRTAVLNEIETVNGSVTVSNFTNVTKISAVNGNVTATNLRGAANLSTVNGQVTADFDRFEGTSKIDLSTVNGQVNLVLPSDVHATIKADSLNGNISNDFGLPVRKGQYVGRDLYGRVGSGEGQVKLSSVNGNLSIGRKSDGRSPNPATNLLPTKKADDDMDIETEKSLAMKSAKIDREVARAMRESQRTAAQSMREAQKTIESIGPDLERIKVEELKNLEKMKIHLDDDKLQAEIRNGMKEQREAMAKLSDAVWFRGASTVEKKRNTFTVKGTPKVTIEAKGCEVNVRGWDKSEVQYVITEMASRTGGPTQITEDHNSSFVTLKVTNHDGGSPLSSLKLDPERVRIDVYVPRKSNLKIVTDGELRLDGVSGEIQLIGGDQSINIRDVDGTMNLSADEAQVRVIGFKGDFDSKTACGDIFLEGDFKKLSAKATDGTVTLTLPADANATVTSNTELESDGVQVVRENETTWRLGKGGSRYNFDFNDGKLVLRSAEAVSSY